MSLVKNLQRSKAAPVAPAIAPAVAPPPIPASPLPVAVAPAVAPAPVAPAPAVAKPQAPRRPLTRPGLWQRLTTWMRGDPQKRLDADERKRRKQLESTLIAESWWYLDRIIAVTERMSELSYRYKSSERDIYDSKVSTIRFSHVVMTPEALYFRLDTLRMPRNVSLQALRDEETLYNMSMACQHWVHFEGDPEKGAWYIVERTNGIRGIPMHVRLDEVWAMRQKSHDSLAIPFGIGENKKPIWLSFNRFYHMLIGGTTGGGKSNIINVILCTLVRFNSPKRLKLCLIDLKGGVELSAYEDLPHIMRYKPLGEKYDPADAEEDAEVSEKQEQENINQILDDVGEIVADDDGRDEDGRRRAFVDEPKKVLPLLRAIFWEGKRRMRLMRKAHARDIGTYNWRNPKRTLPYIIIIFDELAQLSQLPTKQRQKADRLLEQIISLFRFVGIYIVPATQRPDKTVITGNIKQNCPARLAFNCADVPASTLIVGNGRAVGLSPAGRAVLDYGGKVFEVQTPFMPDKVIEDVLQQAKSGQYQDVEVKRHDVQEDEIFRVALEHFAGDLPGREIYHWFTQRSRGIPRQEVYDIIAKYHGRSIMINGTLYNVVKDGNKVRMEAAADGELVE